MARYQLGKALRESPQRKHKNTWMTFRVVFFTIILLVPVIIYIIVTTLPPSPVTGKTIDKGFFDPYLTFETEWFTFRTAKNWEAVPELSKADQYYTYREKNGANPQGLLQIFVGGTKPPVTDSFYTNVVPVTVNDVDLDVGEIADDCSTLLPKTGNINNTVVNQEDVSFTCWANGTIDYVVAGQKGGTHELQMTRRDGSKGTYIISYRNLAFTPGLEVFPTVLRTFQSR